jgi:hypothetical protein
MTRCTAGVVPTQRIIALQLAKTTAQVSKNMRGLGLFLAADMLE